MAMTIVEAAHSVTGGVDTHGEVHVGAALDEVGGLLGTRSFDATPDGFSSLLSWLAGVTLPAPKQPSQVYSVRIPVNRLEELRAVAAKQRLPPSALLREWVLERLDREHFGSVLKVQISSRATHLGA